MLCNNHNYTCIAGTTSTTTEQTTTAKYINRFGCPYVTLKSVFNRKYVTAQLDGRASVNGRIRGIQETFAINQDSDDRITLVSSFNKYLVAGSYGDVNVNRKSTGDLSFFTIEQIKEESKIAVKSYHGNYLATDEVGNLYARRNSIENKEIWNVECISFGGNFKPKKRSTFW